MKIPSHLTSAAQFAASTAVSSSSSPISPLPLSGWRHLAGYGLLQTARAKQAFYPRSAQAHSSFAPVRMFHQFSWRNQ